MSKLATTIQSELHRITLRLVELSLCDEQNMPSIKTSKYRGAIDVSLPGQVVFSSAMKNVNYEDAYNEIEASRSFNVKMIDGGLLQLLYRINHKNELISHRLAFYSSPSHATYQNEPEIYEIDPVYADFLKKNIVPFPVRFDFDADDQKHIEIDHPKSHLTLGQYDGCRIPVTSPIGPADFIQFILRNFYNTAYNRHKEKLLIGNLKFPLSITQIEKNVLHLRAAATH